MTRRFFYHALGVGLGGRITRPFCDVIEAQAATALGTVGGYASSRVDGYRFKDIVSLRSASVHAVGSEAGDGSFNTSVSVTVEGLNILDVITAESITARLTSRHEYEAPEPAISTAGTQFRDLRIGGRRIDVEIDRELFFEESTYPQFKEAESKQKELGRWPESKGMMLCSLVKNFPDQAEPTLEGYSIHVPTVGRIFLGEILVSQYARRLTMLRLELGSPVAGRLEVGSGEVNGSTYP
jgi:hypothetical protein